MWLKWRAACLNDWIGDCCESRVVIWIGTAVGYVIRKLFLASLITISLALAGVFAAGILYTLWSLLNAPEPVRTFLIISSVWLLACPARR